MRTIGRKWSGTSNPPDFCAYCGVKWPGDKLIRDSDGLLQCRDCTHRPIGELARGNAAGARERTYARKVTRP